MEEEDKPTVWMSPGSPALRARVHPGLGSLRPGGTRSRVCSTPLFGNHPTLEPWRHLPFPRKRA